MTGRTMAQKVLARASGDSAEVGSFVVAEVDLAMAHEAFTLCALKLKGIGIERFARPDRVAVVLDHFFPAPNETMAVGHTLARQLAKEYGVAHFLGHEGICHQVVSERGLARPGMLVLGTDSHSTLYGALGAAGAGIGTTEMAYVLAKGELWLQVPPTLRFNVNGALPPGVMSKDVILHLAGRFGTEVAQYAAIEFGGDGAGTLSIASRMAMANMGVELGAKFAFFEADEVTLRYLRGRTSEPVHPFGPDRDAAYQQTHTIELAALEPLVARPHSPGHVARVADVGGVSVQQAFLGSCTNARLEDFAVAAAIVAGRQVHPDTRFIATPASRSVYAAALAAGYIETLIRAGAHVTAPGCGACPGGHGGVVGPGEACISSTNRNFRGRMGSTEAQVYLGSPATVAAAALAGRLVDPRDYWDGRMPLEA